MLALTRIFCNLQRKAYEVIAIHCRRVHCYRWVYLDHCAHGSRSLMAIAFVVLSSFRLWEHSGWRYRSIRCEKRPLPLVLFALFVAFSLLWYYFERVRLGKVTESHSPA